MFDQIMSNDCAPRVWAFFNYAIERYEIFLAKKAGAPKPWTGDRILQEYRFCNVFREDDKVTVWFREHLREPYRTHPDIVFATIAFRLFNKPETAALLCGRNPSENLFLDWSTVEARKRLTGVKPLVSAAYMCPTEPGMNKLEGCLEILRRLWMIRVWLSEQVTACTTMQALVEYLSTLYYMGRFRSYEVACDLQYTDAFSPTDTLTWANPGPGATRGLRRLLYGSVEQPAGQKLTLQAQVDAMALLLDGSQDWKSCWSRRWPSWDMRTVEHTLCEFDKYERVRLGEGKPKQRYQGA